MAEVLARQLVGRMHRVEPAATGTVRTGREQHEGDGAGSVAAIGPVVDRAALDEHIASVQRDDLSVEFQSMLPSITTA